MVPINQVAPLEGQHVEERREIPAIVDLVPDEGPSLLALGLGDAVGDDPGRDRVREAALEEGGAIVQDEGGRVLDHGHFSVI
jgi:hypothetical protein